MRLDLDVVLGDEALAAVQLSLVPVLVIFHVEDLSWDRSTVRRAEWDPPHCPRPHIPHLNLP